jgi:hypothetical protein
MIFVQIPKWGAGERARLPENKTPLTFLMKVRGGWLFFRVRFTMRLLLHDKVNSPVQAVRLFILT